MNSSFISAVKLLAQMHSAENWQVPAVLAEKIAELFGFEWERLTGVGSKPGMRQRIYQTRMVEELDYSEGKPRLVDRSAIKLAQI